MRRHLLAWLVFLAAPLAALPLPSLADGPATVAAGDDDLVRKVRKSIDEAVSFLKAQQRKTDGSWETGGGHMSGTGGATALVVMALLNAGCKPEDESVKRGLEYLRNLNPDKTYSVALQTMALCLARQPTVDKGKVERNVRWLLAARMSDGWSYGKLNAMTIGIADNSNTQYALLALHEAIQYGVPVDEKALKDVQALYVKSQSKGQGGGGWAYRPSSRSTTMTMTTAGLANLIITGLDLAAGKSELRADGSADRCGQYADNEPVASALTWIADRFPARLTEEVAYDRFVHPFYCLYGVERAGRLSGQRFFGGHDWYEIGCRYLVALQRADGSWAGSASRGSLDHWPVVATSFSLLFLSKGRTPVLVSKLAYGNANDMGWNNKRSDVKHLVEFTSRELFKGEPLAWQVFDVRNADAPTEASRRALAAQLLQTPVVYFNGHHMAPRDKEAEILKEYLANGGFVLAENCCGKDHFPGFDRDLRQLVRTVLPDAELKPLEPDHPVWTASGKFVASPRDFPLEGVKQGCKTILIYSPVPLAGFWEGNRFADKARGQKAFELGANVLAYATGLEAPRPRLSKVEVVNDNPGEKVKRGFLQVGQLRHEGDWQPAPKAMRNLMAEARKVGLDVVLKTTPVYPTEDGVLDYRFLYLHGRGHFEAKAADLKKLRFNLKSGGVLLADACCGSRAFDAAFRKFVEELFAGEGAKLEPIPPDDELFGAELNGEAIATVKRRSLAADGKRVEPEFKPFRPALEGVKVRGRWAVIYSQYDIGCALERHSSPDCLGHDPPSALRLGRAAVLYAACGGSR
ncbi:MAG: DUF4159 domain-containing protein [Gemmataceae bacterium]